MRTKRIACYACHFGAEWIGYSVRSMREAVDEIHVFYAPEPSYGYRTEGAVCPETEDQIHAEVKRWIGSTPLFWHRVVGTQSEGEHKDKMLTVAKDRGAEAYILLDADEIWDTQTAVEVFDLVLRRNEAARWQTCFHHFWRSFDWMVYEHFRPIRVVDMRHWRWEGSTPRGPATADASLDEVTQKWGVFHFGYAQCEKTMRYKFTCHSHKPETDWPAWLERVFFPWTPEKVEEFRWMHPTTPGLWETAKPTPPEMKEKLKELLGDHPYWGKAIIL